MSIYIFIYVFELRYSIPGAIELVDLEIALSSRRVKPSIHTILRSYTPLHRADLRLDFERSIKQGRNVKNAVTTVKKFRQKAIQESP